jgi:predicted P-loop ATPase
MSAQPSTSTTMLNSALRYSRMGWAVFPLIGKRPDGKLAPNGSHDATLDEAVIRDWWLRNPKANIAIATGMKFWVLDIDTKNAGDETLDEWESEHGKLPPTIQQVTGTRGTHYLFSLPSDFIVSNSQGSLGQGVDTRGTGGYIVAAPSIHPDTRQSYYWDGLDELENQEILPAPDWLLTKLRTKQRTGSPTVIPTKIPKGQQHYHLVSIAGSMRRRGLDYPEIIAVLAVTNKERCEEPGPIENIEQIARSVCKYPAGKLPHEYRQAAEPSDQEPQDSPEAAVVLPDWRSLLKRSTRRLPGGKTEPGSPIPHNLNAALPLRYDPIFHGRIAWDELRRQITILRPLPFEQNAPCGWEDKHDIWYASWCQQEGLNISVSTASQAARMVADTNSFHPVKQYLESLEWDGTPRINYWLHTYCGASDNPYTQAIGRKWLISAVARAMEPGCKVDHCLILEGKQGILKSSALGVLGGKWYTDEVEDLSNKDAAQQVARVWIVEMGELSAMSRSEKNAVKAFLTRSIDQFRPAYGRHVLNLPRQCVFCGTTNQDQYLEDDTGNRRFWPVWCSQIEIDALKRDRDQIWAEAIAAYREGENWWIEDTGVKLLAENEAVERMREDPWMESISKWVQDRLSIGTGSISIADALSLCLEKRESEWSRNDQMRVSSIYKLIGLKRKQIREEGKRRWEYYL